MSELKYRRECETFREWLKFNWIGLAAWLPFLALMIVRHAQIGGLWFGLQRGLIDYAFITGTLSSWWTGRGVVVPWFDQRVYDVLYFSGLVHHQRRTNHYHERLREPRGVPRMG